MWFLQFTARKKSPNVHAVFERYALNFCTHVSCAPAEPFTNGFLFYFLFAGNVGSRKTQISHEIQKPKYLAKKQKHTHAFRRQGHIKHVRKTSGSLSQKRRGHWTLKEFWVLCLNQPVLLLKQNTLSYNYYSKQQLLILLQHPAVTLTLTLTLTLTPPVVSEIGNPVRPETAQATAATNANGGIVYVCISVRYPAGFWLEACRGAHFCKNRPFLLLLLILL